MLLLIDIFRSLQMSSHLVSTYPLGTRVHVCTCACARDMVHVVYRSFFYHQVQSKSLSTRGYAYILMYVTHDPV